MSELAIECLLNRDQETLTITVYDIPVANLDKVLRDMATASFRTNMLDGIRAQWLAGGPEMMMSKRKFHADADDEEVP